MAEKKEHVIPVYLYDITWNDEKEVFPVFHCTTMKEKQDGRDKYISLRSDELFLTPEQAYQYISIVHSKRIEALNDMLNDNVGKYSIILTYYCFRM